MESGAFFSMMSFSYGEGEFVLGSSRFYGQIILSPHKLYLKDASGEITATFIPLEKICKLQIGFFRRHVRVYVKLSQIVQFDVDIKGAAQQIRSLVKDLVSRRNLMRKGGLGWWIDPEMI